MRIPNVAENTPNLKLSATEINLLLYNNKRAAKIPKVRKIA